MKRRDMFSMIPLVFALPGEMAAQAETVKKQRLPLNTSFDSPYSMTYVKKVKKMLKWVRATQSDKILEAAYTIAETAAKGRKVWSAWDLGHTSTSDIFPGRNGMPEFITPGYDIEKVKDGDLVLSNGPSPSGYIDDIAKKDLFVIGGPSPYGGDIKGFENMNEPLQKLKVRPYSDIWIETNVDHIAAQVEIPGSVAPLGPESGPLNSTIYWMMMADASRVLSRSGKKMNVIGDEQPLPKNTAWANLNEPLMGIYFDEVLRQMTLVGSELGNLKKMAKMAVDTLLSGGMCYFYSRYFESFASEAQGRRGGFSFAKGLSDGRLAGTSDDCVIMGIYEPDDEVDLKNLDEFRTRGMRIASIGPATRNFKAPEGRAVSKETEVHAGLMMDTCGMFAIPGFNRKVCPTSGILTTTILWVMSVEICEEMIRRTNDTPSIYLNGGLKWGPMHNQRMAARVRIRGY
ncbi:MAG: hypothetical protein HOC71_12070 [Candidatus Latescibacteria bacterium]|jgi:hypothetical protein|nr:hypothetical protein [Candidatus Latescibacterota bacterium]